MPRFDNYFELINASEPNRASPKTTLVRLICDLKIPGRLKKIKQRILSHPREVNIRVHGVTPLEIICRNTRALGIAVAKPLLDHGAKVNITSRNMTNPLLLAALYSGSDSCVEMVELLLRYEANPNILSRKQRNTLMIVVKCFHYGISDIQVIPMLLDAGTDINHRDEYVDTVITLLASEYCIDNAMLIPLLMSYGPDMNMTESSGYTPLVLFVRNMSTNDVSALVDLLDYDSSTVNQVASGAAPIFYTCNVQLINVLLAHGADPNVVDSYGNSILIHIIERRCDAKLYTAEALIRHGADVNSCNKHGMIPLMAAATYGDEEMIYLLLRYGADPNYKDIFGSTALMLVSLRYMNANRIIELLIAAGTELDHVNQAGCCALSYLDYRTDLGKRVLEAVRIGMAHHQ